MNEDICLCHIDDIFYLPTLAVCERYVPGIRYFKRKEMR